MDMLSLALLVGVVGVMLLLSGIGLGKLFGTSRKIHERGLDRPLNLSFEQQTFLFFHNPDVSIPMTLGVFGVLMIIVSIVLAIVGAFQ